MGKHPKPSNRLYLSHCNGYKVQTRSGDTIQTIWDDTKRAFVVEKNQKPHLYPLGSLLPMEQIARVAPSVCDGRSGDMLWVSIDSCFRDVVRPSGSTPSWSHPYQRVSSDGS